MKILIFIMLLSCAPKTIKMNSGYFKPCNICKQDTDFWKLKIRIDSFPNFEKYVCDKCSDSLNLKSLYIPEYLNQLGN